MTERDALAQEMFPERWAKVSNATGVRARRERTRLRALAEIAAITRPLVAAGHGCGDCRAFSRYPHGPGHVCDDESSGGTYQMVKAEQICRNWRRK